MSIYIDYRVFNIINKKRNVFCKHLNLKSYIFQYIQIKKYILIFTINIDYKIYRRPLVTLTL